MDAVDTVCRDPLVLDMWHPIAALDDVPVGPGVETMLLGEPIRFKRTGDGTPIVWRAVASPEEPLPVLERYCHLWTSLGEPAGDLFAIPQNDEGDRQSISGGTFGVNTSAPRAVENFLDMGHLPFVHAGLLGAEPHTEVTDYDVEVTSDPVELIATRCCVFQPMAGPTAQGGQISEYTFRVPHPYCAVLYKTSPVDPSRMDALGIFAQAMTEDWIRAHWFVCPTRRGEQSDEVETVLALGVRQRQDDPREPVPAPAPARRSSRDPHPGRQVGDHLPALALESRYHLRRHPGCVTAGVLQASKISGRRLRGLSRRRAA